MIISTVEPWIEAPLRRYVDDARARMALVLHPSGQVLAQAGFTRALDVASACALAAAAFATVEELGIQLDGRAFGGVHHAGLEKQFYLAHTETKRGSFICFTVFDSESSLGLVRLYFDELCTELAASPPAPAITRPALAADFEAELNANLTALFTKQPAGGGRRAAGGRRSGPTRKTG